MKKAAESPDTGGRNRKNWGRRRRETGPASGILKKVAEN